MAMELGAAPIGQWSGSHNTILDADAPDFGAGMGAARYTFQHSIMVNENGQRFVDEGSDFQIYTYAKMGSIVLEQPRGIAFQIFDNKVIHLLREEYANAVPIKADTLEELAKKTDIDPENLVKTVTEFNKAVQPGEFNPVIRDGKGTKGITPPKSNWARKIDTLPYTAYAITTGITFSFGGLKVDKDARILNSEGKPIQNLYATGEMVGGSFYYNYAMGSGITKNVVLGRIAGYNAASFGKEITS
jgi:tricarballylate dehydrogenase